MFRVGRNQHSAFQSHLPTSPLPQCVSGPVPRVLLQLLALAVVLFLLFCFLGEAGSRVLPYWTAGMGMEGWGERTEEEV